MKILITIGNSLYLKKLRSDDINTFAFMTPIVFWIIFSIVLHKLGTRNWFEPSWIYPLLFGPFFSFVLVVFIARYLSDKIFGNYYTEREIGWSSKNASEYYKEAIARNDYVEAKQIVIFGISLIVSGFLLGWVAGISGFWIFIF